MYMILCSARSTRTRPPRFRLSSRHAAYACFSAFAAHSPGAAADALARTFLEDPPVRYRDNERGLTAVIAAATDEAMLIEEAGGKVLIEPAPAWNLKVTTPEVLRVAELLLARL